MALAPGEDREERALAPDRAGPAVGADPGLAAIDLDLRDGEAELAQRVQRAAPEDVVIDRQGHEDPSAVVQCAGGQGHDAADGKKVHVRHQRQVGRSRLDVAVGKPRLGPAELAVGYAVGVVIIRPSIPAPGNAAFPGP